MIRRLRTSALQGLILLLAFTGSTGFAEAGNSCDDWLAARSKWLSDMDRVGAVLGESFDPERSSAQERYGDTYYDMAHTFYQIANYRDSSRPWRKYAGWARDAYVEGYLIPAQWRASGYWRFPHGLLDDLNANGKTVPNDLRLLRDLPALSKLSEYVGDYAGESQSMSREVAYALQANIAAERAGVARAREDGRERPAVFVSWISQHLQQWESGEFESIDLKKNEARFAPFMFGLSAHALIEWVEWEELNGRDPNSAWPGTYEPTIEKALVRFLTWLSSDARVRTGASAGRSMWLSSDGLSTLRYEDRGDDGGGPAWELGNLLAYPYAWAAVRLAEDHHGNDATARKFMRTADELFIATTKKAWIEGGGKFFNQAYRNSLGYMKLRERSELGVCARNTTAPSSPTDFSVR